MADRGTISSIDNCMWFEPYVGTQFIPVQGFSPMCGSVTPGERVAKWSELDFRIRWSPRPAASGC
jgi:hypothetical protein